MGSHSPFSCWGWHAVWCTLSPAPHSCICSIGVSFACSSYLPSSLAPICDMGCAHTSQAARLRSVDEIKWKCRNAAGRQNEIIYIHYIHLVMLSLPVPITLWTCCHHSPREKAATSADSVDDAQSMDTGEEGMWWMLTENTHLCCSPRMELCTLETGKNSPIDGVLWYVSGYCLDVELMVTAGACHCAG